MRHEWPAADQIPASNWAIYKEEIIAEQVKQLYSLLPFGVVATLLNSAILFFILKDVIQQGILFTWLAVIAFVTILRIALSMRFQRTEFQPSAARKWGNRFMAGLILSGVAWGSIGIFPFSGVSLAHQVFIAFVLGGMAAGAAVTFSVKKGGYLAYSLPALAPLSVRFFFMNDAFHYAMGGMVSLYGLLLWGIARRHYMVNSTSLLLRFENRGIIDQLRISKEEVEKLYRELLAEIDAKLKAEDEIMAHRDRLHNLAVHLQTAREEERTSVARDIHDELGQALTAMKMDLSLFRNNYKDHKQIVDTANKLMDALNATILSVKRICTELRPSLLDDFGLVAALEWQASEFQERTGIECTIVEEPWDIELDKERSIALYRVFQEALTNVLRHANATKVTAMLTQHNDSLIFEVIDNGKGITDEQLSKPQSFGLVGMHERLYPWGGKVEITSSGGEGTTVKVIMPLVQL
jgi:signal transduction histidine kinase